MKMIAVAAFLALLFAFARPARADVPQVCTAGTGAAVTSVGTTPVTVCAAASGRTFYRVFNSSASVSVYCTDDNSTPSATSAAFVVPPNSWVFESIPYYTSSGAIKCMAASTVTIAAWAAQFPNPP